MPEPFQMDSGMLTALVLLPVGAKWLLSPSAHSILFLLCVSASEVFSSGSFLKFLLTFLSFFELSLMEHALQQIDQRRVWLQNLLVWVCC